MSKTRREEQHTAIREEIKASARQLMSQQGSAGLSIRGIGRAMEMTAPALYHYYPGRDALITDLILDAFNALGAHLEAVRDETANQSAPRQLMAVCLAYRQWALAHPIDFALIYGTPIPDYEAPQETTVPAAARSYLVFASILTRNIQDGALHPPAWLKNPSSELRLAMQRMADLYGQAGPAFPPLAHYLTCTGWTRMHGVIMLEVFNHLQPVVGDIDPFYRLQLEDLFRTCGLET